MSRLPSSSSFAPPVFSLRASSIWPNMIDGRTYTYTSEVLTSAPETAATMPRSVIFMPMSMMPSTIATVTPWRGASIPFCASASCRVSRSP